MKITFLAVLSATLSACSLGSPVPAGIGAGVHQEAAGVRRDGSLIPGVGKTGMNGAAGLSSAETTAERMTILLGTPYGIMPGP